MKKVGFKAVTGGAVNGDGHEIPLDERVDGLSRVAREIRIIRRQEALLASLSAEIVETPRIDDLICEWLDGVVAAQLEKAGIATIGALFAFLDGAPILWHKRIARLGRPCARYVTRWAGEYAPTLATTPMALPPLDRLNAPQSPQQRETDVVPLETFLVPEALNGSNGENRGWRQACHLPAVNDMEAITQWLDLFEGRPAYKPYRIEVERVLLWAVLVKKKEFSSLTRADCDEYLNSFLSDVQPAERWIGPRAPRQSRDWRPFTGQPTDKARMNARKALFTLGQYLSQHYYLRVNPFYTVSLREAEVPPPDEISWRRGTVNLSVKNIRPRPRVLSEGQWNAVLAVADRMSTGVPANARLQFALRFSLLTGLSRAELAKAATSDLYLSRKDRSAMWLLVQGDRRKPLRCVQLDEAAQDALKDYFELRGHGRLVHKWPAGLPLVPVIAVGRFIAIDRALGAEGISTMFKKFLVDAARQIQQKDPELATMLESVSSKWMRESFAVNSVKAGMPVHEVAYLIGDRANQHPFRNETEVGRPDLERAVFSQIGLPAAE
ncbi:phage integrase family protein [Paraburkholderia strydomiana]|uniref:phage integrase family protein n=1 Tax=Paraburkholderia strydomiana TaxID=1245417 RepID=UPI0038B9A1D2